MPQPGDLQSPKERPPIFEVDVGVGTKIVIAVFIGIAGVALVLVALTMTGSGPSTNSTQETYLPTPERTPTGYWPAKTAPGKSTPYVYVPVPASSPEPVFPEDLIRRKLARDYPDDYVTQDGVLQMQREAFEFMKTLEPSRIKSKVQRDYPNDFVTQKGVYEMQIEARDRLARPR